MAYAENNAERGAFSGAPRENKRKQASVILRLSRLRIQLIERVYMLQGLFHLLKFH